MIFLDVEIFMKLVVKIIKNETALIGKMQNLTAVWDFIGIHFLDRHYVWRPHDPTLVHFVHFYGKKEFITPFFVFLFFFFNFF